MTSTGGFEYGMLSRIRLDGEPCPVFTYAVNGPPLSWDQLHALHAEWPELRLKLVHGMTGDQAADVIMGRDGSGDTGP